MAVSLTVEVVGLDRLERGLGAAPAALDAATRRQLIAAGLLVEGTARRLAPRDTARLQGSITSRVTEEAGGMVARIGPSVAYGIVMERGRRPGARMPPVAALAGWARRHGGLNPYLVARAIQRKGIKARPYMEPALEQNRGQIDSLMREVGVRVVSTIAGGGA